VKKSAYILDLNNNTLWSLYKHKLLLVGYASYNPYLKYFWWDGNPPIFWVYLDPCAFQKSGFLDCLLIYGLWIADSSNIFNSKIVLSIKIGALTTLPFIKLQKSQTNEHPNLQSIAFHITDCGFWFWSIHKRIWIAIPNFCLIK